MSYCTIIIVFDIDSSRANYTQANDAHSILITYCTCFTIEALTSIRVTILLHCMANSYGNKESKTMSTILHI